MLTLFAQMMHDASRRNSVDSVGSNSTAASLDGHLKPATARKTFKLEPSPMHEPSVLKLPVADSLKRRVDSLESNSADSSETSSVKKQRTDSMDDLSSFFGHHFLSGMTPSAGGATPAVEHKVKADEQMEETVERSAESLLLKTLCTCEAESIPVPGREGTTCQAIEVVGGYRVGCKNKITRYGIYGEKTHPIKTILYVSNQYKKGRSIYFDLDLFVVILPF